MIPDNGPAEEVKCKDLENVVIGDDPEKFFQVGAQLPPQEREELIEFLRKNVDVFACNAYEAPGVDPNFICNHLNVNPFVTPKKQPPWRSSKDHSDVDRDEVIKLKQARAIKYSTLSGWPTSWWLKKKNGKWQVASVRRFHRFE